MDLFVNFFLSSNISIMYPNMDTENIHSEYFMWHCEMETIQEACQKLKEKSNPQKLEISQSKAASYAH